MFSFKFRAATLIANLKKPSNGFTPNTVSIVLPQSKVFYLFFFALAIMLIPSELYAQESIDGEGEMFTKFKNFINNQVIPAARILANTVIVLSFVATVILAGIRDPKWKWALATTILVSILWYAGPAILNEIREGFDGTYEIQ